MTNTVIQTTPSDNVGIVCNAFGAKTIEEMGWELFHLILEVASGHKKVATDTLGLYNDLVLFNPGPLT